MLSAVEALSGALLPALGAIDGLSGAYPAPPARATAPWAELGEMQLADWSAAGVIGRELRLAVRLVDRADTPDRLHTLSAAAAAAVAALPRDLPGWRLASVTLLKSRVARDKAGDWAATLEHRVRLSATT